MKLPPYRIPLCQVPLLNWIYKRFHNGRELHIWKVYYLYGGFDPSDLYGGSDLPGGKYSQVESCCLRCGKVKREELAGWFRYLAPGIIVPRKGPSDWPTQEEEERQAPFYKASRSIFNPERIRKDLNLFYYS